MLPVADAQRIALSHARRLAPVTVPLADALGRRLAGDVTSDIDMPPFAKAMMDGYAVRARDGLQFNVIGEVLAGQMPTVTVNAGEAVRIMTGAPVPNGADAVVMVEQTSEADGRVRLQVGAKPGQNIQPRAKELRTGQVVLAAGTLLRPPELGLLAMVGRDRVLVSPRPRVAVLATGDELVEAGQPLEPGQIRNSNGPMLVAQASRTGCEVINLGIARDNLDALKHAIAEGLAADVLLLSGGVSAGKVDLVPEVLTSLGVVAHFHKLRMKPGKPLLFGTRGDTLVFGLPGNPVSSYVGFALFVAPCVRALTGGPAEPPMAVRLPLLRPFGHTSDRPTYHPATLGVTADGMLGVQPVTPWQGSPDLRVACEADALVVLEAGSVSYDAGAAVPAILLEPRG